LFVRFFISRLPSFFYFLFVIFVGYSLFTDHRKVGDLRGPDEDRPEFQVDSYELNSSKI
jgi:hypothetical protein